MLRVAAFFSSLILLTVGGSLPWGDVGDENGGSDCMLCTLFVAIIDQTGQLYQESPMQAMNQLCGYFATDDEGLILDACIGLKDTFGEVVALLLEGGKNPDEVCFAMGVCNDNDGWRLSPSFLSFITSSFFSPYI